MVKILGNFVASLTLGQIDGFDYSKLRLPSRGRVPWMEVRHEGPYVCSCLNGKMRQETHNRVSKGSKLGTHTGMVSKVLETCSSLVTGETQVGWQPPSGKL